MRLHTTLTGDQLRGALALAQRYGEIDPTVYFTVLTRHGSRSHAHAYEVQLGTDTRASRWAEAKNGNRRRTQANDAYAATWDEWGWLMLHVYAADPSANWGGMYRSPAEFHEKTRGVFRGSDVPKTGRHAAFRDLWMSAVLRPSRLAVVPSAPGSDGLREDPGDDDDYSDFGDDDPVFGPRLVGR